MDGKTLSGRYTLGRLLGKGGMGAVHEADDMELRRRVAVKIMNPEVSHSRSAMARFEREARAASAIHTEHIVRVLDTGVDDETRSPFMVMEYLRGEDLAQLQRRLGVLPPGLALRIVAQACVGLQKAHDAGVLHRDIKPANLFLARREDGGGLVLKLLDFGIAKIKPSHDPRRDTTGLTRSGSMLGTPRYMSPEQARAIKEIDHRTDIWSLGVVLYHALAGRTPTEHVEAFGDLIATLVADLPAPVQEFAPWVAPEVAAIVDGALQYQPADRYPSASAMLDAIRPLLGDDPLLLEERMLVPLDASERLLVAPRLEPRAAQRLRRRPSFYSGSADRWKDQPTEGATTSSLEATLSQDYGVQERPASQAPPSPRRISRKVPLAIGVLLAASVGGLVMIRPAARPREALTGMHLALRELPRIPPAPSPAPAPEPPPAPVRRVELAIAPRDASVEIDGAPAALKDGVVELVGPLGTSQEVRVVRGSASIARRVYITEEGALPAKLELPSLRAAGFTRKPRPATTASAAPLAEPTGTSNPLMPPSFQ
ncbi:serine/threonine-protein kinase [Sorangium sp. So ce1036]|uniref:serine/threonine-protein kinase n=1 Tax=Sorangium sp. So ce1036 TaxID=3133328 RepID=UPI003F0EDC30